MKEAAFRALEETSGELAYALKDQPETLLAFRTGNEWSAADCLDHLLILERLIGKVMEGKVTEAQRAPDEKTMTIRNVMLNHDKKLLAAPAISPHPGNNKDAGALLTELLDNRNTMTGFLSGADEKLLCLDFEHRMLGTLTRLEWLYFIVYHNQRHLLQIQHSLSKGRTRNT